VVGERVRLLPGCWLRIVSRVTEIDPPRLLGMGFTGRWFTEHLTYTLTPAEDGSSEAVDDCPRMPRRPDAALRVSSPRRDGRVLVSRADVDLGPRRGGRGRSTLGHEVATGLERVDGLWGAR
jgi:hypothetical protein